MVEELALYIVTFCCGAVLARLFLWLLQRSVKALSSHSHGAGFLLTGMMLRLCLVCSLFSLILFLFGTSHLLSAMTGFVVTRFIRIRNITSAPQKSAQGLPQ